MLFVAQTRSRCGCSRKDTLDFTSSLTTPTGALPSFLLAAISSTSAMKTSTCSMRAIATNASDRPPARPFADPARRDGKSATNGHPRRLAMARAKVVLPVPGGPRSMTARRATRRALNRAAWDSGRRMRRSIRTFPQPPVEYVNLVWPSHSHPVDLLKQGCRHGTPQCCCTLDFSGPQVFALVKPDDVQPFGKPELRKA